jgi:hypothetical protein
MAGKASASNAYGPYISNPAVATFCTISSRAFEWLHASRGGFDRSQETGRSRLLTHLLYIGEATSSAVRLNATWALSLPSMSLVRDRYEQVVRLTWLSRQPDNVELVKFIASHYAKANKVFRSVSQSIRDEIQKNFKLDSWMTETPTKEQREYLSRWENLDLYSMAKKADELASKASGKLGLQKLADLYSPIYQQFSSVSHADMYAVRLLGLHRSPDGQMVLAADPNWPLVLTCYNALFDLIQCHEILAMDDTKADIGVLDSLFDEWQASSDRMTGAP